MSLLHTKLYESKNLESIDLQKYINELATDIMVSYDISENIKLNINIENIYLDIDYALPCGLIINECLTNSFKYAFNTDDGSIGIFLKTIDNNIILEISDTGTGLDKDIDIFSVETLGLQLITTIVKNQLLGDIDYINQDGAKFTIIFPYK
jgi:two-component sensor histidine kinase